MRTLFFKALFLGVVCFGCIGCDQNGEDPYALWQKYSHPDGVFSFYYMAPPFYLGPRSSDSRPVLIVDGYDTPQFEGLNARIVVEAWFEPGATRAEVDTARLERWDHLGYEVVRNLDYVNHFGDKGAIVEMEREERWVKEVVFCRLNGCAVLSVWTAERGSQEDISLLVDSFRPGQGDD